MKVPPPKNALKFLRWFCREDYIEEIEGDLTEVFEKQHEISSGKAKRKFVWSVIKYFRPEFIKSFKSSYNDNPVAMFRHNLLITYRNFLRYKSSFFINLFGLSSGLACALLIYLWVNDELKVDKFLSNDDRLFQVMQNLHRTNGIETIDATPALLAKALVDEMPEVEYSVNVIPPTFNTSKGVISMEDTHIKAVGQYVSGNFFKAFSYHLVHGDNNRVLSEKNSVVVSKTLALKLFGSTEGAVGKTMEWKAQDIRGLCEISGVFESPPASATQQFDLVLNYEWFEETNPPGSWGNSSPRTYVFLKEGVVAGDLNNKIRNLIRFKDGSSQATLFLNRYSDRYLYGQFENGMVAGGRIRYVELFSVIGICILVMACINFMNLTTAKASRRLKEVGIKKAIGARKKTLIFQYLGESSVMAFLSLAIAILIVILSLPVFNQITGKQLALSFDINLFSSVLLITLITGLIAGSYPALYLSGFNPIDILKGRPNPVMSDEWLRRGLVVFQFIISVTLIVAVLVVSKQIEYVHHKNLGYERDHVIYFPTENMNNAFLLEIKNTTGVVNAGGGNFEAHSPLGGTNGIEWEGKTQDDNTFFSIKWVSYYLIETLGMEVVSGRSFLEDFGSDDQIIFNEMAIETMGLKDPIGKTIKIEGQQRQIVGVVKNFHFESLYEPVKPCAILLAAIEYAPKVSVKIQAGMEKTTIDKIENLYQKYNPGLVFDLKFMNDDYERLYASEQRVAVLSRYFAALAIVISCLGLFGLAAFTAERRSKEICIRKILGATNARIVGLLSSDFTKMILIAVGVAIPLSYFIALHWLESFAYHIDLEWWFFAGAGLSVLLITWITIGAQILKTARVNPTEFLSNE